VKLVITCCILHNFCINDKLLEDEEQELEQIVQAMENNDEAPPIIDINFDGHDVIEGTRQRDRLVDHLAHARRG
jgi:hypothetical protein